MNADYKSISPDDLGGLTADLLRLAEDGVFRLRKPHNSMLCA